MAIYADFKEFEIISIEAETTKHMMSDPRRIGKISAIINITLPSTATDRMQEGLKRVAHTCPVSKSLHPEIEQDVQINIELAKN
jgi:organic hydroperoxide reductase OsmC/OhrA